MPLPPTSAAAGGAEGCHGKSGTAPLLLKHHFTPGDEGVSLYPRRGELFLLPFSQMCSGIWQLVVKHMHNVHHMIPMPCGTVRLQLADHCIACSLSTTLLNGVLGTDELCVEGLPLKLVSF